MNLAETLRQQTALDKLATEAEVPDETRTAQQIAEVVFAQADEKQNPFLYMDAEDWRNKWLASKRFRLMRIPIAAAALPCDPKDSNWVITTFHARRLPGTERPIVVDLNKRNVGASPSGYIPPVIVLDGKHRFKAGSLRGDTHILAWVGELAAEMTGPYSPNRSIKKPKGLHIRKAKGAHTPNMHIKPAFHTTKSWKNESHVEGDASVPDDDDSSETTIQSDTEIGDLAVKKRGAARLEKLRQRTSV